MIGLVGLNASAQTVVFSENWGTTANQNVWTANDADGDTKNWSWQIIDANTAQNTALIPQGRVALSESWSTTALTPNNYFFSSAINLVGVPTTSGSVTLKFKAGSLDKANSPYFAEYLSVYVVTSISSTSTIAATTPVHAQALTSTGILSFTYDISQYAGQSVYLVFRHHNCTDKYAIFIDDISVTKASANGLNEVGLDVKVGPNPVVNNLSVSLNEEMKTISFYDVNGTLVKEVENVNSTSTIIDLTSFEKGLYFYSIETVTGKIAKNSIIKE